MKFRSPFAAAVCLGALGFLVGSAAASTLRGVGEGVGDEAQGVSKLVQLLQLEVGIFDPAGSSMSPAGEVDAGIVKQLLMKVDKDGDGKSMKGMFDMLKPLITKLLDQVNASHTLSSKEVEAGARAIDACRGTDYSLTDPWPQAPDAQKDYVKEKNLMDQCDQDPAGPQASEAATCDGSILTEEAAYKSNWAKIVESPPEVMAGTCNFAAASETPELFYKRMAKHWDEKLKEYNEAVAELNKEKAALDAVKLNCQNAKDSTSTHKTNCATSGTKLSMYACHFKRELERVCNSYSACWEQKDKAYNTIVAKAKEAEKSRKLNYRMMKRLGCLINSMDEETGKIEKAKLEACADHGQYDTEHLNIEYPEAGGKKVCDPTPHGKDAAWVDEDCKVDLTG